MKNFLFLLLGIVWLCQASVLREEAGILNRADTLEELVTWDQHSLIIRGERIMFFSGEFHPFRLPVPGLWHDVFQKIKALGFNGVSFYTDWGLLEGNPGHVTTDGIFGLEEFFKAASEVGIYLLARPGPYINAETAAGGMPGWTLRQKGILRSTAPDFLQAIDSYISIIGKIIAEAQITNGGPVIMVQPENEYSTWPGVTDFPNAMNREYMAHVEQKFRDTGIVVPFVVNDNTNLGDFAPGSGAGAMDLYGIDAYPMRYDCAHPYVWPTYRFPRNWQATHQLYSPSTPFTIAEFESGSGDGWGGVGEDQCAILVNNDAIRVQYKNNYSFGVTIFNSYMIYGGTNWGNLGYHGGYTSYDYGAAITEDRHVWREKYSEIKLEANFLKVSPAYLTATPGNGANGSFGTPSDIAITPLFGNGTRTKFYVVRHADFTSTANTTYTLNLSTSEGHLSIPLLGGKFSLKGRDSKIHITDYDVGGIDLVYSSAEIYTWAKSYGVGRVLIVYGGAGETHELAFPITLRTPVLTEGSGVRIRKTNNLWVIQWVVMPTRRVVQVGDVEVYLLWRNEAYKYWVMELEAEAPIGNYSSMSKSTVIIKAGYLLRSAAIVGDELRLMGDVNATTEIEIISVPHKETNTLYFNGKSTNTSKSPQGRLQATVKYEAPSITLPDFSQLQWKYLDSLPEISSTYDDSAWTPLTHPTTNNTLNLTTPTSLYASDYGYHTGSLIYRGHFIANGNESNFFINATGGIGFGYSIWLNSTFLSSWIGSSTNQTYWQTLSFPTTLKSGGAYTLTVLIDHMGQDEEAPGTDAVKFPYGILDYALSGHSKLDLDWKMTGNLGGEQYYDPARGPRNEGAMYAERQGYHLPNPPSSGWKVSSLIQDGIVSAGVGFYTTSFDLHVPRGYDVPMSFVFKPKTNMNQIEAGTGQNYRCQLFVNGYQFGKYVNNLGPQTAFPVPEGILNYDGRNYIALTLWALDQEGCQLGGFELVPQMPVFSGYQRPAPAPQPIWMQRQGAY
ncbi:beta-galactosidase-1 [Coleophoma cylindrospora]|uniref:Beta-galactosidase n=1 Tax=Coleophoma cylindrospora TaxID=1849047 RepID=A0A3D8RLA2_9HELO|nr:beta-galactosidase-1 [Coleophoma cylindrospora]